MKVKHQKTEGFFFLKKKTFAGIECDLSSLVLWLAHAVKLHFGFSYKTGRTVLTTYKYSLHFKL